MRAKPRYICMTYYEACISEEGEAGRLQGDEAGTVRGETDDTLVGEVTAVRNTDVVEAGRSLGQRHHPLVLDVPAALEVDVLQAGATVAGKIVQRLVSDVKTALGWGE